MTTRIKQMGIVLGAYLLGFGMLAGVALTPGGRALPAEATWRDALQRADAALAGGDVREARQAWQEAYRAVMRARAPEGMLDVGRACLRIGEAGRDRRAAVAQARRIYLGALFQARSRRDADVVARAGEAFAALGDREVAERAFEIAMALRARSDYATRAP